jgi:hypothetical protein
MAMKRVIVLALCLMALVAACASSVTIQNFNMRPLAFTQNNGQWDERVQYRADAGGALMWFTTEGVYYQFSRRIPSPPSPLLEGEGSKTLSPEVWSKTGERAAVGRNPRGFDSAAVEAGSPSPSVPLPVGEGSKTLSPEVWSKAKERDSLESLVIKATFVGANPNPVIHGDDLMEYKCNYFLGNDPTKWRTDVPNYKALVFEDIYAGIDLKYYGTGDGRMEYDFLVSPGADVSQIMVQYDGAKSVSVNESGELVIETGWGQMTERRPIVYQIEPSGIRPIEGQYVLLGEGRFGFELDESYEPLYATVIDPVLSYSTYLGGSGGEGGLGGQLAIDDSGCVYLVGFTLSADYPTLNPYQTNQGNEDIYVTKLSSDGSSLVYSTYIGGASTDTGGDIALDNSGCAFVTGWTQSIDFPLQVPYQFFQGGIDAFVTKLNAAGNGLAYSTYLGGSGGEYCNGIDVDASGCAYVTGITWSTDFPTQNPYLTHQGSVDVFVTKLSNSGSSLVYSTYLGGIGDDTGTGIIVDGSGCAYIDGYTASADFPTQGPYQTYQSALDAFVTKLNASGNGLIYSTYLGGSGDDYCWGIALDASDCVYIAGDTYSADFPTQNPYLTDQDSADVYVTRLSASGNSLVYSTYLGGADNERAFAIAVDDSGCAYVTGRTYSTDFPTWNHFQTNQMNEDGFVTKLDASGSTLVYSTYLGGNGLDGGYGIAVDGRHCAYVSGFTSSTNFPTQNPYQAHRAGGFDAFVTKLKISTSVSTLDDPGFGSLREAIEVSNSTPGPDTITFSVSGTIELESALPQLTDDSTVILGSTAPGGEHSVIIDGFFLEIPDDGFIINGINVSGCKIEGLTIRNCPHAGIRIVGSPLTVQHTITNNLIFGNGGLAIDLGINGVNANDAGDTDTGPNSLLNFPEIDSVRMNPDNSYSVHGVAQSSSVIEYYVAHPAEDDLHPADPSGHGEAYSYVIADTADPSGQFESVIPSSVPQFTILSCTATDPSGNTSEFSANFSLTPAPLIFMAISQPGGGLKTPPSVVNLWITDPNGDYIGRDSQGNLSQTLFPADYDQESPLYDDSVTIHHPLLGEYIVEIIAEDDAEPGDMYTINVRIDGSEEVVLAEDMDIPISGLPPDTILYVVEEGCDYINGDANGSGGDPAIDIDDIVFLINYVFASGPGPEPLMSGDADCSLFIDIDDIVYLIGYVFAGAAPPCRD